MDHASCVKPGQRVPVKWYGRSLPAGSTCTLQGKSWPGFVTIAFLNVKQLIQKLFHFLGQAFKQANPG